MAIESGTRGNVGCREFFHGAGILSLVRDAMIDGLEDVAAFPVDGNPECCALRAVDVRESHM
jgi:hypothetical protein